MNKPVKKSSFVKKFSLWAVDHQYVRAMTAEHLVPEACNLLSVLVFIFFLFFFDFVNWSNSGGGI